MASLGQLRVDSQSILSERISQRRFLVRWPASQKASFSAGFGSIASVSERISQRRFWLDGQCLSFIIVIVIVIVIVRTYVQFSHFQVQYGLCHRHVIRLFSVECI
jgi:hypothetical protein